MMKNLDQERRNIGWLGIEGAILLYKLVNCAETKTESFIETINRSSATTAFLSVEGLATVKKPG